jgi:hypothetical protein
MQKTVEKFPLFFYCLFSLETVTPPMAIGKWRMANG